MTVQTKKLTRNCVVCGKRINITLNQNRTYKNGHFFGKLNTSKGKKAEYWECNQCFTNNSDVS